MGAYRLITYLSLYAIKMPGVVIALCLGIQNCRIVNGKHSECQGARHSYKRSMYIATFKVVYYNLKTLFCHVNECYFSEAVL